MKFKIKLKLLILCLLVVLVFSDTLLRKSHKSKENEENKNKHNKPSHFSNSFSKSESFSYSNINGKVKSNFNGIQLEENNSTVGKKIHSIKKGKIYNKNNNDPTFLKGQVKSTNPEENKLYVKNLNSAEENVEFGNSPIFNQLKNMKNFNNDFQEIQKNNMLAFNQHFNNLRKFRKDKNSSKSNTNASDAANTQKSNIDSLNTPNKRPKSSVDKIDISLLYDIHKKKKVIKKKGNSK